MNIPNIVDHVDRMFAKDCQAHPARSIRASAIGNPCARALVYDQTTTPDPISVSTSRIFALGRLLEDQAVADFAEALKGTDIDIVRDRMPLPTNRYGIGGVIDWWVAFVPEGADRKGRVKIPAEFKSMSPFSYDEIHTLADMTTSSKPWVRRYPAQLLTYMFITNTEAGCFILRNKVTGEYRQIDVQLDDQALVYCEELLQRAETVKASVETWGKAQTDIEREAAMPPRVEYTPDLCGKCDHRAKCIPDLTCAAGVVIDPLWEGEVEAWCRIREQNEAAKKAYEEADDRLKAHCQAMMKDNMTPKATKTMVTQTFMVTATVGQSSKFDIPEDIKNKYKRVEPSVRKKITRIDGSDGQE